MNIEEFKEIMARGREQRGVEFKQGGSRKDKRLLTKVVRAIIGMANRRDGGYVIVGVSEGESNIPIFDGVSNEDLFTWTSDTLADSLAEYADPGVNFDLKIIEFENKKYVAIVVHEFEDIPVICKKDYPDVLRAGACYVRTRRKPETLDIPTQTDMRDVLDLAIEKGVRRFVAQAQASGMSLSGQLQPTDSQLFIKQLSDFLGESK